MRLNGLGAPDEVTLVPLNRIEPAQRKIETKPIESSSENTQNGFAFIATNLAISELIVEKKRKKNKRQQTRKNNGETSNSVGNTLNSDTCGKPHKTKSCWNGANATNDPRPKHQNQQTLKTDHAVPPTTTKPVDDSKN